jgi:hypothetical protein
VRSLDTVLASLRCTEHLICEGGTATGCSCRHVAAPWRLEGASHLDVAYSRGCAGARRHDVDQAFGRLTRQESPGVDEEGESALLPSHPIPGRNGARPRKAFAVMPPGGGATE